MKIYGLPEFNITLDRTDRVGLRSLIVSLPWGMDSVPVAWDALLVALDAAEPAPPGTPPGMELMGRDRTTEGGVLATHWTYQGVHMSGKDVVVKDRSNSLDWRFDPGFAQVDLALHPNLAALIAKYEGSFTAEGELYFPPLLSGTASGIPAAKAGDAVNNPMFGEKDFYRTEGTYSFRFITPSNAEIGTAENQIHETGELPGRPPSYSGRNWLKAPTQWQHVASVYEVMEQYWLSGPGGWKKPLYGALADASVGRGGLITGGLQASRGL